ncbi:MAG TPA: hypothetical protein VMH85_15465 [Terriglobales bacterium]|nr:hypothetical protein [Terriglobales bacterium]
MQVGAENRTKLIAALALGALALVLLVRFVFSLVNTTPTSAAAPAPSEPIAPTRTAAKAKAAPKKKVVAVPAEPSLDPTLRFDWLRASEDTKYSGSGRNIFRAMAEPIPTPIKSPVKTQTPPPPPVAQGPPPPPPIPLTFFGFASKPGESKRIFLEEGGDVFIAGEGEIVNRRYKVLRITPFSVEIEDVLTNNRQVLPLKQG